MPPRRKQFVSLKNDMQWQMILDAEDYQKWVEWNKPTYPQFVGMYDLWVRCGKPPESELPEFDKWWKEWRREVGE